MRSTSSLIRHFREPSVTLAADSEQTIRLVISWVSSAAYRKPDNRHYRFRFVKILIPWQIKRRFM